MISKVSGFEFLTFKKIYGKINEAKPRRGEASEASVASFVRKGFGKSDKEYKEY